MSSDETRREVLRWMQHRKWQHTQGVAALETHEQQLREEWKQAGKRYTEGQAMRELVEAHEQQLREAKVPMSSDDTRKRLAKAAENLGVQWERFGIIEDEGLKYGGAVCEWIDALEAHEQQLREEWEREARAGQLTHEQSRMVAELVDRTLRAVSRWELQRCKKLGVLTGDWEVYEPVPWLRDWIDHWTADEGGDG